MDIHINLSRGPLETISDTHPIRDHQSIEEGDNIVRIEDMPIFGEGQNGYEHFVDVENFIAYLTELKSQGYNLADVETGRYCVTITPIKTWVSTEDDIALYKQKLAIEEELEAFTKKAKTRLYNKITKEKKRLLGKYKTDPA